jgi:integrase
MSKTFKKLSRPAMRKLSAAEKITEHGITFERTPNGDGVFSVNIMVDGLRIHRVVGRESTGTTRSQAEEYIQKVRRDARENRLSLPRGRKVALGFREACEKYVKRLYEEGGKDISKKRRRAELHLVPFFGSKPLSKVAGFDVERYKRHRTGEGAKPATINRELAVLSHLFSKAEEWGWIDRRPAKITRYPEGEGRITFLSVQQIHRLIEAAKTDQNEQVYPFVVIGLGTGMRRMEILSIRRENIDLERRIIYIPNAKAGPREQPITGHLAAFLEGYLEVLPKGCPWLFPSPTARCGHTVDIRKAFRRVVSAAGMNPDEVVRHTLRHTAVTHLVQAGVDLPTVQRISGHKTLAMVMRYSHQHGAHIQAAMDKLESQLKIS